jgi:hypothetical protein
VHARAGAADGLDVGHPLRRLEQGMQQDRLADRVLRFEQRDVLIDEVDVPRPLDLGNHDHVELVADMLDDLLEVVEHPGAVQALMRTHIAVSPKSFFTAGR